ncbi:MAG: tRNA pseudouridine(38-40) synthase TruA [Ignavibacteria bacterium]|nr:tRNA pseudouridine(38-40) synthase TruA [Ignavibacteria bacterium]
MQKKQSFSNSKPKKHFNSNFKGKKSAPSELTKKIIKAYDRHEKFSGQTRVSSNRYKLYIEYDGTRFSGWQQQQNSKTVQGALIKAATEVFKDEKIEIYGSGRTDAGVHAICQVAHLAVNTMLAPEIIRLKLNDLLPHDINILEVEKASPQFHARHDAVGRSYVYVISKRRTAFGKQFVWWIKDRLNIEKMKMAAKLFEGKQDYISFADKDMEEKSTLVVIDEVDVSEKDDLILIRIRGSHFLWKMVRRMVGVLVEIGREKLSDKDLLFFLTNYTNEPAVFTAPPSGLYLEQVWYKEENYLKEIQLPINIVNRFKRR